MSAAATIAPATRSLAGITVPDSLLVDEAMDYARKLPDFAGLAGRPLAFAAGAQRFEAGTQALCVMAGMKASLDLMLSVDGDTGPFISNFFTFDQAGIYEVGVREPITHFEARSLAGEHPTRMTRSPL